MATRGKAKTIVFAVVLAVLVFVSIEVLMFLFEPWFFRGLYMYDPDLGYKVRPNLKTTNRFGFNDRDYPLEKEPGTYRILFLGDSFCWAGGSDHNYTIALERMFNRHFGRHLVDVINAGYPMTWTREQRALLEKYGLQYKPDLVVLAFFAGNDFQDADPHRKRIVVNDTYFDIDRRDEVILFGRPLFIQSRLLSLIRQKIRIYRVMRTAGKEYRERLKRHKLMPMRGLFPKPTFLEIERNRLLFCHLPTYEKGGQDEKIDLVLSEVGKIKSLLDREEVEFMVMMIPDEFQVDHDLRDQVMETYDLDPSEYDEDLMQTVLAGYLDELGVEWLDLLPEFRDAGREKRLYKLHDTHWNVKGNHLAAEILFRHLLPVVEVSDPI